MAQKVLVFADVDPAAAEAAALISALDRDLSSRYPGANIHGIDAASFRAAGGVFLIGHLEGIPVACGALRPMDASAVEVKRMYVHDTHRGHGFGRAMLAALEEIASERGYRVIRLETGDGQPEAIALYESDGYQPIPCYGDYAQDPHSRCFEKRLV
jgi:putative acetyltransferase